MGFPHFGDPRPGSQGHTRCTTSQPFHFITTGRPLLVKQAPYHILLSHVSTLLRTIGLPQRALGSGLWYLLGRSDRTETLGDMIFLMGHVAVNRFSCPIHINQPIASHACTSKLGLACFGSPNCQTQDAFAHTNRRVLRCCAPIRLATIS